MNDYSAENLQSALERCWSDGAAGSHHVGAGRYVQWARWPEGVQIECSNDTAWEEGSLSFLQRRILAEEGFRPPDDHVPNYYLRVERREELARAAAALSRCLSEVLQAPQPVGPAHAPDLGRALLRCFGRRGLAYPHVPDFAVDLLRVQAPSTFVTEDEDPQDLYLFTFAAQELVQPLTRPRYAVSLWGHGINSYAWTLRLERPGLRLLAQVGYGGALPDADQDAQLAAIFTLARWLDEAVPVRDDEDIVVLVSDLRDIRVVTRRSRATAADPLLHRVEDVAAAVEGLLSREPDIEAAWEAVSRACAYALARASALGCDVLCFEGLGYALFVQTSGPDQPLEVVLLNSEDVTAGSDRVRPRFRLLARLGWDHAALEVPRLLVVPPDDGNAAAAAMADAIRWVWEFDPAKAEHLIYDMVGVDDGGGEWT